jgi:flavin-dependent dehydrogenase
VRDPTYDVVIVGARCAGATLAALLARAGADVLVVDRDPLPSDQILSTHMIHPPGVDILDELGVGEAIREVTPESPRVRLRMATAVVDMTFADGRHELCPRRERLDGLLQSLATDAGAEVWASTRMTRVLIEDGRAVGVEVERVGKKQTVRARLVVGADGRRSSVAEQVQASEYMGYNAPRAMYWGYWPAPAEWRTDAFPFDLYAGRDGLDIRMIAQTDDDQLLVGSIPAADVARSWRTDPLSSLRDNLALDPLTHDLTAGSDPVGAVRGTLSERYFFRQAVGPGWALVGDAGHHKEFVAGDGITEALIQAKGLASAVLSGGDSTLIRWWYERDLEALPGYYWGRDMGTATPPSELEVGVLERVAEDDRLKRLVLRLPEHQCSPYDILPAGVVLGTLGRALLRGRLGVISEMIAQGRRVAEYRRVSNDWTRRLEKLKDPPSTPFD